MRTGRVVPVLVPLEVEAEPPAKVQNRMECFILHQREHHRGPRGLSSECSSAIVEQQAVDLVILPVTFTAINCKNGKRKQAVASNVNGFTIKW